MQPLRNARLIARLVLVWFALSLGAAIASPLVQPKGVELVCSGAGAMKFVATGDDGATGSATHTLDCPLCAATGAPPAVAATVAPLLTLSHTFLPIKAAHHTARNGTSWQARAPPALA